MPPLTPAQKAAQERYRAAHKVERRYLSYKSTARTFIRRYATADDLADLARLITERQSK